VSFRRGKKFPRSTRRAGHLSTQVGRFLCFGGCVEDAITALPKTDRSRVGKMCQSIANTIIRQTTFHVRNPILFDGRRRIFWESYLSKPWAVLARMMKAALVDIHHQCKPPWWQLIQDMQLAGILFLQRRTQYNCRSFLHDTLHGVRLLTRWCSRT
jgi:hypothetical protein